MKLTFVALLSILASASLHAGAFGGPNSLSTSTDTTSSGTYQATARGESLSGIVRFGYDSNGNQSATSSFTFFVDGMIVTGTVEAAIMSSKIAGVLTGSAPTVLNPAYSAVSVTGGTFNAKINTRSASYFFKGKGDLQTYLTATVPPGQPIPDAFPSRRTYKISGQRTSTTSN